MGSPSDFLSKFVIAPGLATQGQQPIYGQPYVLDEDHNLARGLIGWWLLNEGTAETVYDSSVEGNHGTLTDLDWGDWKSTEKGTAFEFDRSAYGNLAGTEDGVLNITSAPFSFSAWVNVRTALDNAILGKRDGTGYQYMFRVDKTTTRFSALFTSGSIGTSTSIGTGEWHHVSFVAPESGNWQIYIDGVLDYEAAAKTISHVDTPVRIGSVATGIWEFAGTLADIRMYDRALSAEEIFQIYSGDLPLKSAFPICSPTASTPSIAYGGDFLSKLVLTPSLAKGPRNFNRNEPVVFDPEHPHARDLIAWMPLNGGEKDERAFNNPEITFTRKNLNYTHTPTDRGMVGDLTSGDTGLYADDVIIPSDLTGFTASLWGYFSSDVHNLSGGFSTALFRKYQTFSIAAVPWNASSQAQFLIATTGTTGWDGAAFFSYDFPENQWVHLTVTYESGIGARMYIDGVQRHSFGSTGRVVTNSNEACIGYDKNYTNAPEWPSYLYDCRIYSRSLEPAEVFEIYQGVQPVKSAIPLGIPTPTGGDQSGTLTAGQLVLEGHAPSGLVSRVGSLALAGALVLQGAAPTALVSEQGTITAGQLVLEGSAPTAQISITGTVTAGQLVLEGNAPTGEITGVGAIVAGQLALEGNSPTATQTYIGTIVGGELVLEGQAPIGTQTSIGTLVAGQLVLEGNTPTALEGDAGVIVAGELVLEGNTPTAIFTQIGTLTAGQLTLEGNAPTGDIGNQLGTIVAGSLVLQGYAPNDGAAIAGKFGATLSGLTFGIDDSTTKYGITTTYSSGSTS